MSSDSRATVVRINALTPHPNADTLDVATVFGYTVVVKRGEFSVGDLAVYIPVDMVVPDTPEWAWLGGNRQIKAKKLRGIFSQGLLVQAPVGASVFDDVTEALELTKYELPCEAVSTSGENEPEPPFLFPKYTDIESLKRYPNVLQEGELVVLTEKIHGANARFVHDGKRLWAGSRTQIKRLDAGADHIWARVAQQWELEQRLSAVPRVAFYGEIFGAVQDLKYGATAQNPLQFRVFDAFDTDGGGYHNYVDVQMYVKILALDFVPELYRGGWGAPLLALAEGNSMLASHVREGFVVRPLAERWDSAIGRVILKQHGEGYMLRKQKP